MKLRRILVGPTTVVLAAAGLGLVGPPTAEASCVGARISAGDQSGIPSLEARTNDDEPVYALTAAEPVRVTASNLVDGCQDTYATTRTGCGPAVPTPQEPIRPLTDLRLVLRQHGHRWTLAKADTPGPDLSLDVTVELPAAARPGLALLELTSGQDVRGGIRVRIR